MVEAYLYPKTSGVRRMVSSRSKLTKSRNVTHELDKRKKIHHISLEQEGDELLQSNHRGAVQCITYAKIFSDVGKIWRKFLDVVLPFLSHLLI